MRGVVPGGRAARFRGAIGALCIAGAGLLMAFAFSMFFRVYNCEDAPPRLRGDCAFTGLAWALEGAPALVFGGGLAATAAVILAPPRYRWLLIATISAAVLAAVAIMTLLVIGTSSQRHTLTLRTAVGSTVGSGVGRPQRHDSAGAPFGAFTDGVPGYG